MDMEEFEFLLMGKRFPLAQYLHGQPVRVLARTIGPQYAWNFEVWHEKQAQVEEQDSLQGAVAASN